MKKLNKLNTKILTFVLSLMMISTQASIVVASQNNVSKSSEEITQPLDFTNSSTPASGAGYTWNSTSKTLTLSGINMNITPTGQNQYAILVPIGSKIISQKGTTNRIAFNADDDDANAFGTAIKAMEGNASQFITITGNGVLELNITGIFTEGINVKNNNNLIIKDMTSLKISSPSSTCRGIASDGKTTIQNSNITISTGNRGITASPLIIEDSTISISSHTDTGVYANGESLIRNSNVTIDGTIYAWTQDNHGALLTVDNSTVKANIKSKTDYCFYEWQGAKANGFIFKNGSTIRTSGGSKSVVTSGDSFIKFDDVKFYYNDIKITDYKTNAAFTSNNIIVVADYSAVNEAIKKANKLTASHYKSFNSVTNAINAVVRDKVDSQQDEVDAMATTIENAMQALVYKDADYRKVKDAISKIPSDLRKYTDDSVKELNDAVHAVQYDKNLMEQGIVNRYAINIENAIKNLTVKPVKKPSTPKTGDTTSAPLYLFLTLCSLGTIIIIKKKRFAS